MIDRLVLVADAKALTSLLVEDLRARSEADEPSRLVVRGEFERARSAGRTNKSFEEWREDVLAQIAPAWVLASVFVRFSEDNGLVDTALLSGPDRALEYARDRRAAFFADHPTAGDREWLEHVFGTYQRIPAVAAIFGDRNPLWQLAPSADGARAILELWWARDDDGRGLRHDFTDPDWDTRFLGDLYQDLSEHARKQYALLQTPEFVEEFILDRTLDPAIDEFGLDGFKMIDPACGSGHFLLGAFHRLFSRWRDRQPASSPRELAQRALDSVDGVDINPFAVEIARFRLLVAALKASEERRLADLPAFQVNVAVGDSLLHGTRGDRLLSGAAEFASVIDHHYPTEDADHAERILQADTYHAVVGNPPYITVKDPGVREAYRALYDSAVGKFSMTVPFIERFHELAVPQSHSQGAGFVGLISGNSFTKRSFGKVLIESFLAEKDLCYIVDTSRVNIPGHGTPTLILITRDRPPSNGVRAVLSIREATGKSDTRTGGDETWQAILAQIDRPGTESAYVSVEDVPLDRFRAHPWSLQGGSAPRLTDAINIQRLTLRDLIEDAGVVAMSNMDEVFVQPHGTAARKGIPTHALRDFIEGTAVRDWTIHPRTEALFPYEGEHLVELSRLGPSALCFLWSYRTVLGTRATFSQHTYFEEGRPWWEWHQVTLARLRDPIIITFAFIATHNHFAVQRQPAVFNRSAPVIRLPADASIDDLAGILGVLNSSVAWFWLKQQSYDQGTGTEAWERRVQVNIANLLSLPVPIERPVGPAKYLDSIGQGLSRLGGIGPGETHGSPSVRTPWREVISKRRRMVALQEELDWQCYRLYGLLDENLTYDLERLPEIDRGQRAFEIALARRMAAGEVTTTWFARHGSTPITEIPSEWPEDYKALVRRRLEVIESDRGIGLLERPEYKRRWHWDDLADLERHAQREWLLDRIEQLAAAKPDEPAVTTCARLADALAADADAVAVADDLAGPMTDLVTLVTELVDSAAVPYLAAWRHTDSGLRKRQAWEHTWQLQRIEDQLDARTKLPADHPDHLDPADLETARKQAGVDRIPVPPKYTKGDYRKGTYWTLRGKLDVPKERFISYPATRAGSDTTPVVGWAGWDHLQQARALAGHYTARKADGAEPDELIPLLAGVAELVPWLLQWHNDPDPVYGERMGQFFDSFVTTEAAALGVTRPDLTDWRPPTPRRGRKPTKATP